MGDPMCKILSVSINNFIRRTVWWNCWVGLSIIKNLFIDVLLGLKKSEDRISIKGLEKSIWTPFPPPGPPLFNPPPFHPHITLCSQHHYRERITGWSFYLEMMTAEQLNWLWFPPPQKNEGQQLDRIQSFCQTLLQKYLLEVNLPYFLLMHNSNLFTYF